MRSVLILWGGLCFFSADTLATECKTLEELRPLVVSCESNAQAVKMAEACSKKILDKWAQANTIIQRQLSDGSQDGQQKQSFQTMTKDYLAAFDQIYDEIEAMQGDTALIARYPEMMVMYLTQLDGPSQKNCFSRPLQSIQKIVNHLDDEIIGAKKTLSKTTSLLIATMQSEQGIADLSVGTVAVEKSKKPSRPLQGPEGFSHSDSGVSGSTQPNSR